MALVNTRKAKQQTLDNVFNTVKESGHINRKSLITETMHDGHTIDLCLKTLLISGKILKQFVRMSGCYEVNYYEVNI